MPRRTKDGATLLETCVENNNPYAIYILAENYMNGDMGYPKDSNKAIELFLKAGELGCAVAYGSLGSIYNDGEVVGKDLKKAKQYYELAAIGGCIWSRHNLACLEGDGGNDKRAVKHLMISAKAGHEVSLKALTQCFKNGLVTKYEYSEVLRANHKEQEDRKSANRNDALVCRNNNYSSQLIS